MKTLLQIPFFRYRWHYRTDDNYRRMIKTGQAPVIITSFDYLYTDHKIKLKEHQIETLLKKIPEAMDSCVSQSDRRYYYSFRNFWMNHSTSDAKVGFVLGCIEDPSKYYIQNQAKYMLDDLQHAKCLARFGLEDAKRVICVLGKNTVLFIVTIMTWYHFYLDKMATDQESLLLPSS